MKTFCKFLFYTLIILVIPISAWAEEKVEGEGFSSPEEAVTAYIDGLQKNDIDTMLSTFAVETFAENYDLEKHLDRMKSYSPSIQYVPNSGDFAFRINCETRRSQIMDSIRSEYLVLQNSDIVLGEDAGKVIQIGEGKTYTSGKDFISQSFAGDERQFLSGIRFEGDFVDPGLVSSQYNEANNQEMLKKTAEIYGADEIRSTLSAFYRDNDLYALCMDCIRYGDKWYLYIPNGNINNLLGISFTYGGLIPLYDHTLEEVLSSLN